MRRFEKHSEAPPPRTDQGCEAPDFVEVDGPADIAADYASVVPSAALRERIMEAVTGPWRWVPFRHAAAELLDLPVDGAERLLVDATQPEAFSASGFEGVSLFHVSGGSAVKGCITGFVKVAPGHEFPHHGHLGDETVLVIAGQLIDDYGVVHGPGARLVADESHSHGARAGQEAPLVYLAVVERGIRIGNAILSADDPSI